MNESVRIRSISKDCMNQFGYFPVSFSYPEFQRKPIIRNRVLSKIIPGRPYSFDTNEEYLSQYSNSQIAITHKKAGWDCFRHLEIMHAGCTPLMLDIDDVPEFTMTYYPKDLLSKITRDFNNKHFLPTIESQLLIREHFDKYLTCESMIKNVLGICGYAPKKVLFLDDAVVDNPDYLSIFVLIGLKKLFGNNCLTFKEPNYLYEDFKGDTSLLYGKGFGYSRLLKPDWKCVIPKLTIPLDVDLVVVGSLARNLELVALAEASNKPIIFMHGEDLPPTSAELNLIHQSRASTFVREVY
jgi:hypothetical protein